MPGMRGEGTGMDGQAAGKGQGHPNRSRMPGWRDAECLGGCEIISVWVGRELKEGLDDGGVLFAGTQRAWKITPESHELPAPLILMEY